MESSGTSSDPHAERELSLAGRIADWFVDSKLTVLLVLFAFFAGGLAFWLTPRLENPRIVVPAANIIVEKPGASPTEIEQLVVKPLEAILQGMSGIEHTYGLALDSLGVVSVQFEVGEDKEDSLVKLYNQIMSNVDRIPPGARQPLVKPADVDEVPILVISLSSATLGDMQLRRLGNHVLERLRRVEGTSVSFVHGGRRRQINVQLDLGRMRAYNVTLAEIRSNLEATNIEMPAGSLASRNFEAKLRTGRFLRSAKEVGALVVGLHEHRPVYLRDVARVEDGPGEVTDLHHISYGPAFEGERPADWETPAVSVAIAKRAGTNAVTVAQDVLAELERAKSEIVPEGVFVNVTRNDGARAADAVSTLMEHLAIAIGTIILLLVFFLGWRAAGIVTITIPLILLITLAIGYASGQTINRITLFALILALGLLVDDSIVVIENIFRHYGQAAGDRLQGAVRAVDEIGRPTNVATFAVILAFLPMFWVSGMMGPYMGPIPFYVPVAMIVSLAIAYTVAPWAAYRWLKVKGHEVEGFEHHHTGLLEKGYAALMRPLLENRTTRNLFFLGVLGLMMAVLVMPVFDLVKFKMLPKNNTNTFNVSIDLPEGTALEATDGVARRVADVLRAHPEVSTLETTVGQSGVIDFNGMLRGNALKRGSHVAELRVNLSDKHAREKSSIDIVLELREAVSRLARETGANVKLVEDPPGPPVRATILAELYGPDYAQLRKIAEELRDTVFGKTTDVVDIDDSTGDEVREYRVVVNREKAALSGIPLAHVAETLRAFVAGYDAGTVHFEDELEPVAIRIRVPQSERRVAGDLDSMFCVTPQGRQVSLANLTDVVEVTALRAIHHKDQRPVVYVTGELGSTSQVYAVLSMWNHLKANPLPSAVKLTQYFMAEPGGAGVSLRWDGEMRLTLDVFRDLGAAFGVAIVLIYLVLVGYYRSFITPMIVMGAIPLTIVGVFPGHTAMGEHFTATSMIGVIALAGVVVRNSLLLIDFILEYRRSGHGLREAVLTAGVTRLRPIMLTAMAIILGTLVMIVDPVFGGLAISLIFGTFASTALTLLVIPLVYYAWQRRTAGPSANDKPGPPV
jgi:multidrug efflux pump subunit AcrB